MPGEDGLHVSFWKQGCAYCAHLRRMEVQTLTPEAVLCRSNCIRAAVMADQDRHAMAMCKGILALGILALVPCLGECTGTF